MEKNKKLSFRNIVLIVFLAAIIVSFLFLKIKDFKVGKKIDLDTNYLTQLPSSGIFDQNNKGLIKKFGSYQELQEFISDKQNNSEMTNYFRDGLEKQSMAVDELATGLGSSENNSVDFSETNIQVEGVDEADIIKTDGKYIYAVVEKDLYIAEAYPTEGAKLIKKISFEDYLTDIYVKDGKLVAFGNISDFAVFEKMISSSRIWPGPYNNQVFLQVFDISDVENPVKEKDFKIEGNYFNSRLIGDHLYFIVNNYSLSAESLPRVFYQEEELSFDCQGGVKCLNPDIYYFDTAYNSFNFSSIFSLNLFDSEEDFKSSYYLLPAGQNMYVSPNNIYLSYTKYLNEYEIESEVLLDLIYSRLSEKDRQVIEEIKNVSDKILSPTEKKYKIRNILDIYISLLTTPEQESLELDMVSAIKERYPNLENEIESTILYKLSVFNGVVEPMVEGSVPGSLLNQFSMDEYNSYFRVATTKNVNWSKYSNSQESSNNVYMLDGNMQIIGSLENMAPGERIYSVRFLGDKGYVVTFEQVDPLFSLDLGNPYSPTISGELKIPGFSNYLHPYGNDKLIGFGQDTEIVDDRVITKGLKLSLFDVSQGVPAELDSYIIGDSGSESIALYDHHAFLFSANKNILAVPVVLRDNSTNDYWGRVTFNGFMIFEIIDNKFQLKGEITHLNEDITDFDKFMNYSAKRSLYIEDNFYSFSNKLIKINNLVDLSDIKSIELK